MDPWGIFKCPSQLPKATKGGEESSAQQVHGNHFVSWFCFYTSGDFVFFVCVLGILGVFFLDFAFTSGRFPVFWWANARSSRASLIRSPLDFEFSSFLLIETFGWSRLDGCSCFIDISLIYWLPLCNFSEMSFFHIIVKLIVQISERCPQFRCLLAVLSLWLI